MRDGSDGDRPAGAGTGSLALALALAGFAAAGCEAFTGPEGSGSLSFDHGGAVEGTFDVEGPPPRTSVEGVPEFGEWTLGAAGDSLGGIVVAGFRTHDDDTGDLFVLQLDEVRTGTFACEPDGACHGRVLFGIPDHGGLPADEAEAWFEIVSGTVEVAEAGGGALSGTFSFTARDEGGSGAATLVVDDGSFDLPPAGQRTAASVVCLGENAAGEECG